MPRPAQTRILSAILAILIGLQGCVPAPPSPGSGSSPVSLLVQLDAPAFIRREGWSDFQSVSFGALVYSTDLLKTDGNIILLCADLQTVKPMTGRGRNPCPLPQNGTTLTYDDMLFSPGLRGTNTSIVPSLIAPRNTTLLDTHPLLQWLDTGAASYTVEIQQGSKTIWIAENITGSKITYPSNATDLEAGKDYLLVVTDNTTGHKSTEDKEKGLGFQVVGSADRVGIETQQQEILNLPELDEQAKKMALAMYYLNLRIGGRGLWNDARLLLEEVSQSKSDEPIVFLRMGDVHAKMKLWDQAESAYQDAVDLAEKHGDLEVHADALAALWRLNPANQTLFDQAVSIFDEIGAKDTASALRDEKMP